jgi:hypothetical protein
VILDRVQFSAVAPWPAAANGNGASLQVIDSRRGRDRVANWSAATSYNGPRQLIVITNQWRYYQDGPLEATWKDAKFNDSAWPQGPALLYVEGAALPAPKSTALTLGQNAYYFRTTFAIPTVPTGASLMLSNVIDDGAVFYLNGKEVYRQGIDDGPVDFNTLGYDFRNPKNAVGDASWAGPFTLAADALIAGTNVLAAEVHQVNATSSDIVFGCTLDLQGGTLVSSTPGAPNSVAASLPAFPPVWLNELMPENTSGLVDNHGEHEPWIELINAGDQPVNLDGWFLSDSYVTLNKWPFPAGVIVQPGQFLIVFADGESGESTPTELHTNFRLTAASGSVALSRTQLGAPAVMDYADYSGLAANVAYASVPDGQSFHREATSQPTPGGFNATSSNRPPSLQPIANQNITQSTRLAFNVTATDPDPGQQLTFSLDTPVPIGAVINPSTGAFEWFPTTANLGVNAITVRVTDNGAPPLSAARTFQVIVGSASVLQLDAALVANGTIVITWLAERGVHYRVEYKDSLDEPAWKLFGEVIADATSAAISDTGVNTRAERFFRVVAP